jgi:regulator of protease activity HflC (stomatin/prohibitin superfamily)
MKFATRLIGFLAFLYLVVALPALTLAGMNLAADLVTQPDDIANAVGLLAYPLMAVHALLAVRFCLRPTVQFFRSFFPMRILPLLAITLALVSCTKVEPGFVGIKVNQYGNQKGVEDFPLHTGRVWFNVFTTDVYKFPTFRQNVVWTKDLKDDEADDSMTFNSVEGSVINADIALSYSLVADKVPLVFVTFRKDIEHITHIYVRSEVRDAIARHAGTMKVIDVFGARKQELLEAVKKDLNEHLGPIGFEFEMVSFIGGLRCDANVMESINATIQATQLAISAQNKIVQAKAEADQAIETARGQAQSILAVAKAQAEANLLVSKSLTPELVQWKSIEKWNGVQPTVMAGQGAIPLIQVGAK